MSAGRGPADPSAKNIWCDAKDHARPRKYLEQNIFSKRGVQVELSSVKTGASPFGAEAKSSRCRAVCCSKCMVVRLLHRGGQNNGIGGRPEFEPNPRGSGERSRLKGGYGQVGSRGAPLLTIQAVVDRYRAGAS